MDDSQLDNLLPPEGTTPPPAPPKPPPADPPPPPKQPSVPPAKSPSGSVLAASDYMQVQGREDKKGPGGLVIFLIVLIFLLVGGAVVAAWQGYINLPFLFAPPKLSQVLANLNNVESARLGAKVQLNLGPHQSEVTQISFFEEQDDGASFAMGLLSSILATPEEGSLELDFTTDMTRHLDVPAAEMTIGGRLDSEGTSMELAATLRLVEENLYVRPDIIPPMFTAFVGNIKDKWILAPLEKEADDKPVVLKLKSKVDEQSVEGRTPQELLSSDIDPIAEAVVLFGAAIEQGALTAILTERGTDPLGRESWIYHLQFDADDMVRVQHDIMDQREQLLPGINEFGFLDKKWLTLEEKYPKLSQAELEGIMAQTSLLLYVDRKTKLPQAYSIEVPLAFADMPFLVDKQISMYLEVSLDRINQPVEVEAPSEFMEWKEAFPDSGKSPEEQLMRDQMDLIMDYRDALDAYHDQHGAYPEALDQLMGLDVPSGFLQKEGEEDKNAKVVVGLPNDLYTGQPYGYTLDEEGEFELTYQLQVPEDSDYYIADTLVNGTNTATPTLRSREGFLLKDSDDDGLTDEQERELGTLMFNPDTDGDGFTDGEEVAGGYDPLN